MTEMTVDEIIAGLVWKLELDNYLSLNSPPALQHWQHLHAHLDKHNCLDNLITVIAGALTETELQILFNPQGQHSKSYTEAFSNWIALLDFVTKAKSNVKNLINQQATTFILINCTSSLNVSATHILTQLQERLYLWNEYLDNDLSNEQQYLKTCLNNHPDKLKQLIAEIGKPLIADELTLLLTESVAAQQKMLAKQYWDTLIQYIRTRYNPQIMDKLINEAAIFLNRLFNPDVQSNSPIHFNSSVMPRLKGISHSLWRWRPISPREEIHPESACQSETLPHGFKIIAARVRGKKHKHDGTNCDDWFEIAKSGQWGIIAVADGAGSKMFSRIGARVACQAAVSYLKDKLTQHQIEARDTWSTATFARDKAYRFQEPDLELTQQLLHEAMQSAYEATEQAYYQRDQLKYYYKALGNRDLTLDDFATTLLLAIHTVVTYKATDYSFILTCQIGDGISAAIYKHKAVTSVLGEIEQNGFSGETQFLTSSKSQLTRDYLCTKTYPFFSPMRALMVMTDGVADDYFPPSTEMLRLFGDMVLNDIIPNTSPATLSPEEFEIIKEQQSDYMTAPERITEQGPRALLICSVTEYAKIINRSLEELVATPALLAVGVPTEIKRLRHVTPENRLQLWLDTYHVRGSFDDRTLVILFDELSNKK